MFFAIAHIKQPPAGVQPPAIVRLATPPGATPPGATPSRRPQGTGATPSPGATPTTLPSASPARVVRGSVFEMPPGLPAFLTQQIVVPKTDEDSEFAALASVARQTGVPFSHTGPDYALVGTKVPFGQPVPSYEFLWYVGHSYLPGTVYINGSGAIAAVNQSLAGGSLAGG